MSRRRQPGAPPLTRVRWRSAYRIIAARYPPIALFERVADPADWESLVEIESLTNERIRDEVGEVQLVPPGERVTGPGASFVMAAFTHIGRPSRFSDGHYGIYYAAHTQAGAIGETTYHYGRFFAATGEAACELTVRVLVAGIDAALHDIRGVRRRYRELYDPDDYSASQVFGRGLRDAGSKGLVYHSVRVAEVDCVAAFRPRVVKSLPKGDAFFLYHWDGQRIDRYFDYSADKWVSL